jgi:hypothetical protein
MRSLSEYLPHTAACWAVGDDRYSLRNWSGPSHGIRLSLYQGFLFRLVFASSCTIGAHVQYWIYVKWTMNILHSLTFIIYINGVICLKFKAYHYQYQMHTHEYIKALRGHWESEIVFPLNYAQKIQNQSTRNVLTVCHSMCICTYGRMIFRVNS